MQQLNIRLHLARNLRSLREESRHTQKTFIARLRKDLDAPMDPGALSKKEKGERAISVEELLQFAAVLDVSPTQLLIPRPGNGDLHLSGEVSIPAPRAREWITGRSRLSRFDGVPASALTLPEDALHDRLRDLRTEIMCLETEIRVREELIDQADRKIEQLTENPTLFDTDASNLTAAPFEEWVNGIRSTNESRRQSLTRLRGKEAELQRSIEDPPAQAGDYPTQPQADIGEET